MTKNRHETQKNAENRKQSHFKSPVGQNFLYQAKSFKLNSSYEHQKIAAECEKHATNFIKTR